jgi:hypothetical protein
MHGALLMHEWIDQVVLKEYELESYLTNFIGNHGVIQERKVKCSYLDLDFGDDRRNEAISLDVGDLPNDLKDKDAPI